VKTPKLFILAIALLALALPSLATAQTALTLNIGPSGYNCGRVTNLDYCYGIPTSNGSIIWLDAQPNTGGFIVVQGITYPVLLPFTSLQTGSGTYTLIVNFGQASALFLSYKTYYSSGGGGRGGAGSGWRWVIQPTGSNLSFNE